jgi:hypothetical protein
MTKKMRSTRKGRLAAMNARVSSRVVEKFTADPKS